MRNRLLRVRAAAYGHKEPQGNFKYTDASIQRIIDKRVKEGKSMHEIAVDLNHSPRMLKELWITRCRPIMSKEELNASHIQSHWTPEEMKHLLDLQHRGAHIEDVKLQFPSKSPKAIRFKIHREFLRFPGIIFRPPQSVTAFKLVEPSAAASEKDESKLEKLG